MYALDAVIAQGIPTLITPFLTAVFISLTHLGDWHVIISFTLIVSGYYMLTHRPTYVYLLATLMLACIVVLGLKFAIGRPRPDIAQLILVGSADTSFPSWHAALSLTFYGYLAYLYISASVRTHRRLLVISRTTILIWIVGFHESTSVSIGSLT